MYKAKLRNRDEIATLRLDMLLVTLSYQDVLRSNLMFLFRKARLVVLLC